MNHIFTKPLPLPPNLLRDRAERLLALSIALDAMDPLPPAGQPPFPQQPAPFSDANAARYEKLMLANRELYEAEFGAFLQEAKQFRDDIEAWALEVGTAAKAKGGEIRKGVPPMPPQPVGADD